MSELRHGQTTSLRRSEDYDVKVQQNKVFKPKLFDSPSPSSGVAENLVGSAFIKRYENGIWPHRREMELSLTYQYDAN